MQQTAWFPSEAPFEIFSLLPFSSSSIKPYVVYSTQDCKVLHTPKLLLCTGVYTCMNRNSIYMLLAKVPWNKATSWPSHNTYSNLEKNWAQTQCPVTSLIFPTPPPLLTISSIKAVVCVRIVVRVGTLPPDVVHDLVFPLTRDISIRQDHLGVVGDEAVTFESEYIVWIQSDCTLTVASFKPSLGGGLAKNALNAHFMPFQCTKSASVDKS